MLIISKTVSLMLPLGIRPSRYKKLVEKLSENAIGDS